MFLTLVHSAPPVSAEPPKVFTTSMCENMKWVNAASRTLRGMGYTVIDERFNGTAEVLISTNEHQPSYKELLDQCPRPKFILNKVFVSFMGVAVSWEMPK